jgi:molybdopterin-binding protein
MAEGMAMSMVKVDIGGGNVVTSIVTMETVKDLGIKVGGEATVLIKATSVILGSD